MAALSWWERIALTSWRPNERWIRSANGSGPLDPDSPAAAISWIMIRHAAPR
jgi:hypothetical protein